MAQRHAKPDSTMDEHGGIDPQHGERQQPAGDDVPLSVGLPWEREGDASGSERGEVLARYRILAASYDYVSETFQWVRRAVVRLLDPLPGEVVLDVGCGTGLCFPWLEARIGAAGGIVGIDQSPEMLVRAQARVRSHGWDNVVLLESPVEDADIPGEADAALFCATHDILRSPVALKNVVAHLRPGARVAAAGGKWAPAPLAALNATVAALHAPYVSSFEGFDAPWSHLAGFLDHVQVTTVAFGAGYLAVGTTPT